MRCRAMPYVARTSCGAPQYHLLFALTMQHIIIIIVHNINSIIMCKSNDYMDVITAAYFSRILNKNVVYKPANKDSLGIGTAQPIMGGQVIL